MSIIRYIGEFGKGGEIQEEIERGRIALAWPGKK
jgi:hypothetical protein